MDEDILHKHASEIIEKRNEIIDLFCKTFIAVQDVHSTESIIELFNKIELECKLGENFSQTFRIKLREDI